MKTEFTCTVDEYGKLQLPVEAVKVLFGRSMTSFKVDLSFCLICDEDGEFEGYTIKKTKSEK